MKFNRIFSGLLTLAFFASCGGGEQEEKKEKGNNEVVMHILHEPQQLNPYNNTTAISSRIVSNIFQQLQEYDFQSYELKPSLAKSKPETVENADSTMSIIFEIRDEATWPDGSPVTAKDIEFTLKLLKNPHVDCASYRPYYEAYDDMMIDPSNPKKFTTHCKTYHLAVLNLSEMRVLNKKVFDPKGLLDKFSIKELTYNAKALESNPVLKEQAEFFNKSFNKSLPENAGSGPYQFEKWESFQYLKLKKNKNWWGHKVQGSDSTIFYARPDALVYKVIDDDNTALVSFKSGKLDVMSIPPHDFKELSQDAEMQKKFHFLTPDAFSYFYMGLNMRNKKLKDLLVRKALSQLVDVDKIIETVEYGYAKRLNNFIHPLDKLNYNTEIKPVAFDVEAAKKLLAQSGWTDSNGDGVVDKTIDGEKVDMELTIIYAKENKQAEKISEYFQISAKRAGVKVIILPKDGNILFEDMAKHNFELYLAGWSYSSPSESDPAQLWHTTSTLDGGSNYTGFGDAKSDAVIDQLRRTVDPAKRAEYYKQLQQMVSDAVPYIFLYTGKRKLAVSKRFTNVEASATTPGFDVGKFTLVP
ncbi:MAG: ABC transporter substrate-binding protein [Flavobacteriales bacterium]